MRSPDDIAAELPPPRDDEPASLRRDIMDELADHLACALERERQREEMTPSAAGTSPWQRVLDRFGSPPAIALQLWRQAMQESLFMQRLVLLAAIFVMGATCFGMYFIVRTLTAQNQAILAQQREMAETLRRVNEQARGAAAPRTETSVEWVPVEVQLRSAESGTSLRPGYLVYLARQQDTTGMPPWEARTDDTPFVKFPLVRYGRYTLKVEAPWGEFLTWEININPGAAVSMTIDCPVQAPRPLVVKPRLVVPPEFQQFKLFVQFRLGQGERQVAGHRWRTLENRGKFMGNATMALVGTDGAIGSSDKIDELEPFQVRDKAGDDLGVRWPGEELVPGDMVSLCVERTVDARGAYAFPLTLVAGESNDGPHPTKVIFHLKQPFSVGPHISVVAEGDGQPLRIELTEEGGRLLRDVLQAFKEKSDYEITVPNKIADVLVRGELPLLRRGTSSPTPMTPAAAAGSE